MIFQANGPPKQSGKAVPLSDKVNFKLKLVRGSVYTSERHNTFRGKNNC
jgi:hypothetical protein